MNKKLTKEQRLILKQCLWDRNETPEEFYNIIKGRSAPESPSRVFCVVRLLEYVGWYDIVKIFKPAEICALWTPEVRRHVRGEYTKEGMDFACRILH
jgi:hypothetical protein